MAVDARLKFSAKKEKMNGRRHEAEATPTSGRHV
jgi:hypothetical protein